MTKLWFVLLTLWLINLKRMYLINCLTFGKKKRKEKQQQYSFCSVFVSLSRNQRLLSQNYSEKMYKKHLFLLSVNGILLVFLKTETNENDYNGTFQLKMFL